MAIDVAELLEPVAGDNPVGEDLSYDSERQEIETAFDTSISGDGSGEDETDWRSIIRMIEGQSARTKDIWLAVYLCRAGVRSSQIDVTRVGAQFLAGLLERYWDDVHPQLDEYGFQGRKGPCESLVRVAEFLGPLQRVVLLRHPRLGEYNGRDFQRFAEGGASEDGYGMFRAALEDVGSEGLREIVDQLDGVRDGIRRTDSVLTANSGDETGTNFAATYEVLEALRRSVLSFSSDAAGAEEGGEAEVAGGAVASGFSGAPAAGFSGTIDSREAVLKALDAIIDYYHRREPGSPMPVLLTRARDWVPADFLTILEDIAPNGVDEVRRVLVSQRQVE
jgi:type VI secretion system protein ImpA